MYYRNAAAAIVVYDVTKAVSGHPRHRMELSKTQPDYDIDLQIQSSLEKAKSWVKELQRQANSNIVIAFVGNKIDLVAESATPKSSTTASGESTTSDDDEEDEADDATATPEDAAADTAMASANKRQVSKEEAEAYAKETGLLFAETSAKTGEGVVEVFTEIGKLAHTATHSSELF